MVCPPYLPTLMIHPSLPLTDSSHSVGLTYLGTYLPTYLPTYQFAIPVSVSSSSFLPLKNVSCSRRIGRSFRFSRVLRGKSLSYTIRRFAPGASTVRKGPAYRVVFFPGNQLHEARFGWNAVAATLFFSLMLPPWHDPIKIIQLVNSKILIVSHHHPDLQPKIDRQIFPN